MTLSWKTRCATTVYLDDHGSDLAYLDGGDVEEDSIERVADEYVHSWVLYANDGTSKGCALASAEILR